MSECSLTSSTIRQIVDGVTISGLKRLGLAGNHIDCQGIDHVVHYLRSGVCHGLDLVETICGNILNISPMPSTPIVPSGLYRWRTVT